MTDDVKPASTRAEAEKLFGDATSAMQEAGTQIAAAKKTLSDYMAGHHLDPANQDDVAKAKQLYQSSLKVTVVDDPSAPGAKELMQKMYGLYCDTFPIPEEREELGKLENLLEKNHDPNLQAKGAPFREQWVIVQDPSGDVVAAQNFITFSAAKEPGVAKDVDGTMHLTYIFVDPRYRSLGLGDFAMRNSEDEARKFVASTYDPPRDPGKIDMIQVAEQNAPLELSMQSSLTDTAGAKIDQFFRRKYFEGLGFREIGYNYTQLPLEPRNEGGAPGEGMNLIIRGLPAPEQGRGIPKIMTQVSSDALRFHLYNFFDRSVAAGRYDIETDPDWIRQSASLHGVLKVKPELDFMSLQKRVWNFEDKYIHGPKFDGNDFDNEEIGHMMHIRRVPVLPLPSRHGGTAAPIPAAKKEGLSRAFASANDKKPAASRTSKPVSPKRPRGPRLDKDSGLSYTPENKKKMHFPAEG